VLDDRIERVESVGVDRATGDRSHRTVRGWIEVVQRTDRALRANHLGARAGERRECRRIAEHLGELGMTEHRPVAGTAPAGRANDGAVRAAKLGEGGELVAAAVKVGIEEIDHSSPRLTCGRKYVVIRGAPARRWKVTK